MFIDVDLQVLKNVSHDIESYDNTLVNDYFEKMREYIANLLTEQGIKTEDVKAILTTIDEKVVYYANNIRTNLNGLEENIAASLEGYNVILEMAVSKLTELFVVMQDYTTSGNFDFTESDAVSYIGKSDGTSNIEIPNQNETTNTEAPEFADRAMEYMNMDGTINPEGTKTSDEGKSFSDLAMDHLNDDATANYQGIDSNAYVDAVSGADSGVGSAANSFEATDFADRAMEYMNMDGTINPQGNIGSNASIDAVTGAAVDFDSIDMDLNSAPSVSASDIETPEFPKYTKEIPLDMGGTSASPNVDAVSGAAANIDVNSAPNASASGNDNSNSGNMASVNGPFVNREVIS